MHESYSSWFVCLSTVTMLQLLRIHIMPFYHNCTLVVLAKLNFQFQHICVEPYQHTHHAWLSHVYTVYIFKNRRPAQ